ncbi:hypothetical protein H5410_053472 [Solanum commersonii]|uniref:NADP-dependent oxidoreductase domain-containing protein n=1 Tax=Solanum commersonii TaxID=4109 RepID=A0A9J5X5Z8_SOLCO|nr:hypothetical protein H5410_053472 [Solanum commersonii]
MCFIDENALSTVAVKSKSTLQIGEVVKRQLKDGVAKREDLFITSKLWMKNTADAFTPENLIPADIPSTWQVMEKLYDSGKAKAIGVSNFSTKKLGDSSCSSCC